MRDHALHKLVRDARVLEVEHDLVDAFRNFLDELLEFLDREIVQARILQVQLETLQVAHLVQKVVDVGEDLVGLLLAVREAQVQPQDILRVGVLDLTQDVEVQNVALDLDRLRILVQPGQLPVLRGHSDRALLRPLECLGRLR